MYDCSHDCGCPPFDMKSKKFLNLNNYSPFRIYHIYLHIYRVRLRSKQLKLMDVFTLRNK